MITYDDVLVEGSTYELSLLKLVGKQVKDVQGYISREFGHPVFKLTRIVFEDDTYVYAEGEHDCAYVTDLPSASQPNLDKETLQRFYDEHNA